MDITRGETVEAELDAMIRRRHDQRVKDVGQRRVEELWMPSERAHFERKEAEHRAAWHEYELRLYRIHSGLAAEHLARAERLEANGHHEKGEEDGRSSHTDDQDKA